MRPVVTSLPPAPYKYQTFDSLASHYGDDAIMSAMASLITSLTIVYSTVYSGADFVRETGDRWIPRTKCW